MNTRSRAECPASACAPATRPFHARLGVLVKPTAVLLLALTGCSTPAPSDTPMLDTRNPEIRVPERVEASRLAWEQARHDPDSREKARAIFKSLVWSTETPRPLRLALVEMLLEDDSPDGEADSRRFTMLRMPTEPDRAVVGMMALAAASKGWEDSSPALVRRLAEPIDDIPDAERVEALALQRLHPGKSLERIVFEQFSGPGAEDGPREIDWADRVRADAWMLLSRLDPSGRTRRGLILDPGAAGVGAAGPLLTDLRAAVDDLGVVPSTAMELEWLRSLRNRTDTANARWWQEVSSIVVSLDDRQRADLELRHLEPIRLAAQKQPAWLRMSRAELISTMHDRLSGRRFHRRTAELDGSRRGVRERFDDWTDALSWGDVIGMLMIDEAIRSPGIAPAIIQQAELDRADRQTEYGGVLEAVTSPEGRVAGFRVVLFPPRPRDRVSDEQFIASRDMIEYSDRALAHYHMHAQRTRNFRYAGPSTGDLNYARMSGRNNLVFTSIDAGRMGVDYYQPDGVVVDLGEISE